MQLNQVQHQVQSRTHELQRALAEREQLVQELEVHKEAAETANVAKGDFLAYLCHGNNTHVMKEHVLRSRDR